MPSSVIRPSNSVRYLHLPKREDLKQSLHTSAAAPSMVSAVWVFVSILKLFWGVFLALKETLCSVHHN